MRFDDLCQQITGQIIDAIDSGVWRAPWHHNGQANLFAPVNAVTDNPYSGSNILILALAAIDAEAAGNAWESETWATYRQLQSIGAQVRRGEHGTRCVKWVTKLLTDPANDGEPVGVLVPKVFTVFNVAQTNGYTPPERPRFDTEPIAAAEAFIAATGANIDVGYNTAKYRPLVDRIQVPAISQYRHTEDYHAVLLHEMCHWTAHKTRLNRQLGERFGDDAYAAEELIAELGAAFACARLGIDPMVVDGQDGDRELVGPWQLGQHSSDPVGVRGAIRADDDAAHGMAVAGDEERRRRVKEQPIGGTAEV